MIYYKHFNKIYNKIYAKHNMIKLSDECASTKLGVTVNLVYSFFHFICKQIIPVQVNPINLVSWLKCYY